MLRLGVMTGIGQSLLGNTVKAFLQTRGQCGEIRCRRGRELYSCGTPITTVLRQVGESLGQGAVLQWSCPQIHYRTSCLLEIAARQAQGAANGLLRTFGSRGG